MDLKIINETIDIRETIFEGSPEQGFECDILLPDYCPDVRRILKCHVTPKVSQCYQNGDKANIDGFIFIKIYYLCDENKIHCYDSKLPYSKTVSIKDSAEDVSVSVGASTNYVNCRAVNQRRFDVRGAITLKTKVTGKAKETVLSDAAGDGIQLKKKSVTTSSLCSESVAQFSVQEEENVSGAEINAILRSEAFVTFTDVKIIPNKAILKGELKVTTTYTDAEGLVPATIVNTIPVSRIVDIDRLTDECRLELKTDVVSLEVLPKQDENGVFNKLAFDVKVNIFAKCYMSKEISVATDAYSTGFECSYTAKKVSFDCLDSVIDETFTYKTQIELSDVAVDRVVDLWGSAKAPVSKVENSKITVDIPVDVFAFYIAENGSAEFCEKTVSAGFETALADDCCAAVFEPDVKIISCEYSLVAPNRVEIRMEMNVTGSIIHNRTDKCITEISMDYSVEKASAESPALTIYYCDRGESVWDIAKRYSTCADCIMNENELDCETISENRIILIPSSN